ncbi:hypothetical protein [Oceanicoccus sagamiensis]|uniref:Uncharacterized protein n=1 Tax=Oceanicoccus sagamiensis TaxID=716816 RepID=A0A1X9NDU1_9GAMM|nr:hypothetical protein [Oceanicoccus sagamiensis]ARN75224.1 hypothetical protein BST96_14525 [Oceanicoccus sagamiensis]
MTAKRKLWLISALLYLVFFSWYTDFRPPLSDQEIDSWKASRLADNADPAAISRAEQAFRNDSGGQLLMINLIDYNENPGLVKGAQAGESAEDLMMRYMQHMLPAMLARGSHPVLVGDTVADVFDWMGIEGAEHWDSGSVFRYRSRRTLFDIVSNPAFVGEVHFKHAAISKTIAIPVAPQLFLGDLRLILGLLMLAVTALLDALVFAKRNT